MNEQEAFAKLQRALGELMGLLNSMPVGDRVHGQLERIAADLNIDITSCRRGATGRVGR